MRYFTVGLLVVLLFGSTASSQSSQPTLPDIQQLMSARDFEAAGLRKLSPDELSVLNDWLRKYTLSVAQVVSQQSPAQGAQPASAAVIETRIDGEFEGWEGETIFKLQNGQIWQQSSYAYTYHYAYSPEVLIYRSTSGYKMKVDGVHGEISVRRLK